MPEDTDNSFRKAFHHLKLALVYFEDVLREMPNQIAGKISKTCIKKIEWLFLNFKTHPQLPRYAVAEFDNEINADPMLIESIPELWHKLNAEQKSSFENMLISVIAGEKITVILNENI